MQQHCSEECAAAGAAIGRPTPQQGEEWSSQGRPTPIVGVIGEKAKAWSEYKAGQQSSLRGSKRAWMPGTCGSHPEDVAWNGSATAPQSYVEQDGARPGLPSPPLRSSLNICRGRFQRFLFIISGDYNFGDYFLDFIKFSVFLKKNIGVRIVRRCCH